MRIRISHSIAYAYAEPVRQLRQVLRLTPRDHDGQHVMSWRIEPNIDGRLRSSQDPFGNLVHDFSADGPIENYAIEIKGMVETVDLAGVIRGVTEKVPPAVFMRDTRLTEPSAALRDLTAEAEVRARGGSDLSRLHALLETVHETIACVPTGERVGIGASACLEAGEGIPQDVAHVFMTCARSLGAPARYVSGYVAESETLPHAGGAHAWAEAYLPDYGWIGFDCANGLCPIDTHIRVAAGLDYADAAPVRGARTGGNGESLLVEVRAQAAKPRLQGQ
ncbi:transglutaminase family protein [Bosea rubneri]|uniref:Transglutaminase family protein n=1 Tax=Bosea rubneri TaxID=3075434 RepID=A0ABU3S2T1_9HYPH|nr:transglutaminase family protein [Bosea sp. ZW T0_25]MDU0339097.1 transglutaminase family protein [Bosea sp. ZW T0_25]